MVYKHNPQNISVCASGSQSATVNPRILTSSKTFRKAVGEQILLPCSIQNLGKLIPLWKKQQNVITAGELMINPDTARYQLDRSSGYNLLIRKISPSDAGDYTCSITTYGQPVTVTHTLEILGTPQFLLESFRQIYPIYF